MTTRALKRDLAALEKDMSPVTLASEARDAARASNARRGNVPQKAQRGERSLDDVMRKATEAARASGALGRNHVAPTNSRSRGQAR